MYKNYFFRITLISIFVGILAVVGFSQETEEIWVTKLIAETSNQLLITIQTEKTRVKIGESIPIQITVKNNNEKPIFFVKKETPEIINEKGDILIVAPYPYPEDKEEYDYSFQKIESGCSYNGQILIPSSLIQRENEFDIRVGLGFVYDITNINRKLKSGEDPVRLRGPLSKRMEVVVIGDLTLTSFR